MNLALGCLREMLEHGRLSLPDVLGIIEEIESKPSLYLLDKFSERREAKGAEARTKGNYKRVS
ncbi:MAG: hypothetical protein DRJ69_02615 [Thermoprotei archaeon]|nr:MAG: hypothetical protein DRJ69_02615 [Thermoprotei archaeon]